MSLSIPPHVKVVLEERIEKLRSPNNKFPPKQATMLINEILELIANDTVEDRFHLDLAIVTTRVAHAFDIDENGSFIVQDQFRERDYLAGTLANRSEFLDAERRKRQLEGSKTRTLTAMERDRFVKMHSKAREPDPSILDGVGMDTFLDAQTVCLLAKSVQQINFHGISSFDGTFIYVASDADDITVVHELEHNIRRFVEKDPHDQASLVSPMKDRTLQVNGVQCEAGFVSEHRNGHAVDEHLVSPFSARWARIGFR